VVPPDVIVLWENYRNGELYVSRSIWNGRISDPKTRKSRAPVPVIRQLAERLEMHRLRSGNPLTGPISANDAPWRSISVARVCRNWCAPFLRELIPARASAFATIKSTDLLFLRPTAGACARKNTQRLLERVRPSFR